LNDKKTNQKIKVLKDGPYLVTGGVALYESVITPKGNGYEYRPGRLLPQKQTYTLCRCGHTSTPPFCDGSHGRHGFTGEETADRSAYSKRATKLEGAGLDLLDDGRCAFARFCHREAGDAWELSEDSGTEFNKREAIIAANECPAGRLTAVEKNGTVHEPALEPSIEILQDPEEEVSAGIYVKGGIPIESSDGSLYEIRNRVVLCRCGHSKNKPFCDMQHIVEGFLDEE
jgi:CDGSH-type Zn-finger protein